MGGVDIFGWLFKGAGKSDPRMPTTKDLMPWHPMGATIQSRAAMLNPYRHEVTELQPAEYRKPLGGAAMTPGMERARKLAIDPGPDHMDLAWFACEASDEEWVEYCRVNDAWRVGLQKCDDWSEPKMSFWPAVAADGAVIFTGR